jgi:DNA-binding SARP family transcriptional activator
MDELQVFLFGKFSTKLANRELEDLSLAKAQELFCYLLLNRGRPHYRESLATILWDNTSLVQSKGYLRKALWRLHSSLGARNEPVHDDIVLIESDWIQLNPEANYWFDVAIFEQAFDLAQGISGRELDLSRAQKLQSAVDLYRGDLLDGWYQEWCLYERERLQHMYLIMLDKLMDYCEAYREYENGLAYGTRILRYDLARERTHRRLMRLHYLTGNRTEALRQYERCVAVLKEELGVDPARQTMALNEQIRADRLVVSSSIMGTNRTVSGATTSSLAEMVEQLNALQLVLSSVQGQIQRKIETIEMILSNQ